MSGPLHSALYRGAVEHRRHASVPHAFRASLFMVYLDLDEIGRVFEGRWLWSAERPAIARFRRADYLGDPAMPLADAVRRAVAAQAGAPPAGPVRMLTHLRYFGYAFNPVTFYYCFDAEGREIEAIVAEITNTPWGERHRYVLTRDANLGTADRLRFRTPKSFHVSPFMGMDLEHHWSFSRPGGPRLVVHMENHRGGERLFDATLSLERREIDGPALAGALLRYPGITAKVSAAIYFQALRLWLKGAPFHPHPKHVRAADREG